MLGEFFGMGCSICQLGSVQQGWAGLSVFVARRYDVPCRFVAMVHTDRIALYAVLVMAFLCASYGYANNKESQEYNW